MSARKYSSQGPAGRGGSRWVAWLALLFSVAALAMSSLTLLLTWRDGQLVEDAKTWLHDANEKLRERREADQAEDRTAGEGSAEAAAPSESAAESNAGEASRWERLSENMQRAEAMIRDRDGRVREYLEGLGADLAELKGQGAAKGGAWMEEAAAKFQAIREQVSVDAPAAARRLRELSEDVRRQVQTLRTINNALRAAPAPTGGDAPAEAGDGEATQP